MVEVYRGVLVAADAYDNYEIAEIREKEIREGLNLNDDETGFLK